ncbi:MAG TPA: 5-(carboxyamino)imidazole ribonucleotide synthase [Flavitalea sp.]|nr:5-(carboxyamino)imidazole ribonucleotide synthase [Flavitalea sp.]
MQKVGILGGGQLGRMLLLAAANYPVETFVLEKEKDCPAAHLCHQFIAGDIRNFDDVYRFGQLVDSLTIEIESVNEEALFKLESEGKKIFPRPATLAILKNKIAQKDFYKKNQIPSPAYFVTQSKNSLNDHSAFLPAVHKAALGGYDGRGVQMIRTKADFEKGFDGPAVLEKLIRVEKEIAQIIAVNEKGEMALYPPVEMVFDHRLNLLNFQICPAMIPEKILWKVEAISVTVVKALKSPGIFAVELFVDDKGDVMVNETAPRVHNSGHHTIEANFSSQFDMLWRVILGYPLGNTTPILPACIVNVIGAEGYSGPAKFEGLHELLQMDNVFVHLYGKKETRPGRKMGHVTVLSAEKQELLHKVQRIKQTLQVIV